MRIDLKKERTQLYRPSTEFEEVEVPPLRYLAMDGHGDPNIEPAYAAAVQSLFTAGYAVRAVFRSRTGDDFVVVPLEGLWWSDDYAAFLARDKARWSWTMLIPLPDRVTGDDIAAGVAAAAEKKPDLPIGSVRPLTLEEGRSLQILHIGSYDDETPTLTRLHAELLPALGLTENGLHHEIYLGDPRRSAPEKLRTVLRQPVRPLDEGSRPRPTAVEE